MRPKALEATLKMLVGYPYNKTLIVEQTKGMMIILYHIEYQATGKREISLRKAKRLYKLYYRGLTLFITEYNSKISVTEPTTGCHIGKNMHSLNSAEITKVLKYLDKNFDKLAGAIGRYKEIHRAQAEPSISTLLTIL